MALILGVLAAIAIPVFAAQKGKAVDAQAKALARTAETTAEVVATDNNGEYTNVSTAELNKAEPSIRVVSSTADAYLSAASGTTNTYLVTAKATDGNEFTISRRATGEITRSCKSPTNGCGGAATGSW